MNQDHKFKNILQEYFQAEKLPLPKYESRKCGGFDHKPEWISTVILSNNENTHITGDISTSKIKAELSAAEKALSFINSNKKIMRSVDERTALFVDVENMPKFIDDVINVIDNITIYAFIGHHHCLANKSFPSLHSNNIIKILSPSTRTDGSDTCMQVYIGYLLSLNKYDTYLIATHDHYGSSLVDMIVSNSLLWNNKQARIVTHVSHI